ncbi:ABC-F family ATP-binding cassette domain-containing protein [Rarobacter faecitabidus]|uniref:Macrolide transport system ATP-binding/permease protein n=1 Tax=Rarobacter faecitabidus TaxID=13243 RepID=A0A542ZTD7_RARFA|nr:ATP-binding cassette domain-containing protein [Rarobacter faecitabidus]TQL63623.1 macrolide transport system ATP-binding/permease protein [Rarobacter faecitabidus]
MTARRELISARDLGFAYPSAQILTGVSFHLVEGGRIGIVGENGAGKTTLLRLLAGELEPSAGTVAARGTLTYVPQDLDPGDRTTRDLVLESLADVRAAAAELQEAMADFDHLTGDLTELAAVTRRLEWLAPWDSERRTQQYLTRLDAPAEHDRRLDGLSVGERYRVRLACALARRDDVLLLDEPTNHLDDAAIDFVTGVLHDWPGAVAMVTHDRKLLDDVATQYLDLSPSRTGTPQCYGAIGYERFRQARDTELVRWRRQYQAQRRREAHLERVRDRSYEGLSDEWRPPKGSQKHRRGTRARTHVRAADRQLERIEADSIPVPQPPPEFALPALPAHPPGQDRARPLLRAVVDRPLGTRGGSSILSELVGTPLEIAAGERLLVTGPNGSGKSTLLRLLAGQIVRDQVRLERAEGVRVGVLVQDGPLREPESSATTGEDEATREVYRLLAEGGLDPAEIVPAYSTGLLAPEQMSVPLAELSTGQRRRFELIRALIAAPHILILDEPTNHLSIDLVDELSAALRETPAAVIVASHDRRLRADFAHWPRLELGSG